MVSSLGIQRPVKQRSEAMNIENEMVAALVFVIAFTGASLLWECLL